jgi:hypothetical protein
MSRTDENVADFWFQKGPWDVPMMCGPGIAVVFAQASGLVHALRIGRRTTDPAGLALKHYFIQAASAPEAEGQLHGGRRIENPVYQEIVPHELTSDPNRGICALLTGSGFDHHFSAVFSLGFDRASPDAIVFEIDVADRCRGPVEKLAATYLMTGQDQDVAIATRRPTASSLTWNVDGGVLELEALAPAIIDDPSTTSQGVKVQIQARIDPQILTHRLHYRWRWAS